MTSTAVTSTTNMTGFRKSCARVELAKRRQEGGTQELRVEDAPGPRGAPGVPALRLALDALHAAGAAPSCR